MVKNGKCFEMTTTSACISFFVAEILFRKLKSHDLNYVHTSVLSISQQFLCHPKVSQK